MASPIDSLIQKYTPQTVNDFENALKEIMQEMALAGLARANFFNKAAFYGGTALKIFHGLPRFSEDLDFTLLKTESGFSLNSYFASIADVLHSFGFVVEIDEVKKDAEHKVVSAFLRAPTQTMLQKIPSAKSVVRHVPSNKVMKVKFEVDISPPLGFETEVKPLHPPLTAAIKVLTPSSLFAGKVHAVLFRKWNQRVKGRDFYDLLWFLGKKIPLKLSYLEQKMKGGQGLQTPLDEKTVMSLLSERIKSLDWTSAKQDVIRFLKEPKETEPWGTDFFLSAIEAMTFVR